MTAALLAAVGFFALGYGAILLTGDSSPTAIMWPADAFALCLMLTPFSNGGFSNSGLR